MENKKRVFYPMITRTIKSILESTELEIMRANATNDIDKKNKLTEYILDYLIIIKDYPNHKTKSESPYSGILTIELDRQYDRWNKGGLNGNK